MGYALGSRAAHKALASEEGRTIRGLLGSAVSRFGGLPGRAEVLKTLGDVGIGADDPAASVVVEQMLELHRRRAAGMSPFVARQQADKVAVAILRGLHQRDALDPEAPGSDLFPGELGEQERAQHEEAVKESLAKVEASRSSGHRQLRDMTVVDPNGWQHKEDL